MHLCSDDGFFFLYSSTWKPDGLSLTRIFDAEIITLKPYAFIVGGGDGDGMLFLFSFLFKAFFRLVTKSVISNSLLGWFCKINFLLFLFL